MNHRITYSHFKLDNGLEVIIQPDRKRPFVAVNLLYKVGSRNDPPQRTGFAHLFEHLMFAGSAEVDNFDDQLHRAGGENNAYTTNDYTLYYDVVPAENLETALWLESDRMRSLNFSPKILATQKKVVVEEFKETCLEEPYGDADHHLYGMAYQVHPYRWPVIGKDFADIEAVQLEEVKDFFYQFYRPNNAIISLCGNIEPEQGRQLVEKYFGDIPAGQKVQPVVFPKEPDYNKPRLKKVTADVPSTAIYQAYPIPGRLHPDFYALDVLAFLLGSGRSSRLFRQLVREQELFHTIEAGLSDMFDSGLFLIEGRVDEAVDPIKANEALLHATAQIVQGDIHAEALQKVLNKLEVRNNYADISLNNRGGELCLAAALGNPEMINTDSERYQAVTVEDLQRCAATYLLPEKRIELIYEPQ